MPDLLTAISSALVGHHLESHVVGGAVRDRLLGRPHGDIDLVVAGEFGAVLRRVADTVGAKVVVVDNARGYLRVALPRRPGVPPTGWVDVSPRAGTLTEDLKRRDFTVNAMAVPLARWPAASALDSIEDPTGGRADVSSRVIRQTSEHSLDEDPLRGLRACRLAAQLGFDMEPATAAAVSSHAADVTVVAPERVREELFATIGGRAAATGIRLLDAHGLLECLLPEVCAGRGVSQPREHYWDVFEHSVRTVGEAERLLDGAVRGSDPVAARMPWPAGMDAYFGEVVADDQTRASLLKIAAVLHDVAKPETKSLQPDGRTRFFGHADRGAEIAAEVLRRLRASRRATAHVSLMVREHLRPVQLSDGVRQPTPRALLRYFRDVAPVAVDTVYLAAADYLAARGPRLDETDWKRHADMLGDILRRGFEEQRESKPSLLFDGHRIQRLFGLPPGPEIGRLLGVLREAEAAGEVQNQEEALDLLREAVREGGGPGRSGE